MNGAQQGSSKSGRVRNLSAIYVGYTAARKAALDKGVLAIFLVGQGLSNGEIGFLQTVLYLSIMATEIPTGVFGDRYGRGLSVTLGLLCSVIYCLGLIFADHFWHFVAVFVVLGLGRSFVSGSDQALLYDALKADQENQQFAKIEARARAVGGLSLSLAMVAGGVLAEVSWTLLYLIYLGLVLASVGVWSLFTATGAGRVEKDRLQAVRDEETNSAREIRDFLFRSAQGRSFALAVLGIALVSAMVAPFYFFAQTTMVEYGLEIRYVGAVYGFIEFAAAACVLLSSRVERLYTFPRVLFSFYVLIAIAFFCASLGSIGMLLVGFVVVVLTSSVFDVIAVHYLHRKAPAKFRASAMSLASFLLTLLIAFGFSLSGYLVDLLGRETTYLAASVLCLVLMVLIAMVTGFGRLLRPQTVLRKGAS